MARASYRRYLTGVNGCLSRDGQYNFVGSLACLICRHLIILFGYGEQLQFLTGTLGKVGNCQIAASVHAATDAASAVLDRRL